MDKVEARLAELWDQQQDILRRLIRLEVRLLRLAEAMHIDVKREVDHAHADQG